MILISRDFVIAKSKVHLLSVIRIFCKDDIVIKEIGHSEVCSINQTDCKESNGNKSFSMQALPKQALYFYKLRSRYWLSIYTYIVLYFSCFWHYWLAIS